MAPGSRSRATLIVWFSGLLCRGEELIAGGLAQAIAQFMNRGTEELQRTPVDFILFAIIFIGFLVGAAGLVATIVPVAVSGALLMLLGFFSFILKGD
jgi:hypothetical protein